MKAVLNPWAALVFASAASVAWLLHGRPGVGQYIGFVAPALIIVGEFLIAPRLVPRVWWWLPVSLLGWIVGLGFGGIYGRAVQDAIDGVATGRVGLASVGQGRSIYAYLAGVIISYAFLGLGIGLGQWLLLRQRLHSSYAWAAATSAAFGLWGLAGEAGGAVGDAAGVLAAGAISGIALQLLPTRAPTSVGTPLETNLPNGAHGPLGSGTSPDRVGVGWATIGGIGITAWYLFFTLTSPTRLIQPSYYEYYLTEVLVLAALTIGVARRSLACTGVLLLYVIVRTGLESPATDSGLVGGFRSALLEDAVIIVLGRQVWQLRRAWHTGCVSTGPQFTSPPGSVTCAAFWRREVAALIDFAVAYALVNAAAIALGFAARIAAVTRLSASGVDYHSTAQMGVELGLVVPWFYFAAMESSGHGATVGKLALNLRVQDLQGLRVSFDRASARYWAKWLSALPLFAGYAMALFSTRRQALHDRLAGCLVVAPRQAATTATTRAAPVASA